MEEVVLHAPDDAPERRQVPRQHAVVIHARHRFDGGRTLAQQLGEGRVDLGVERQIGADLVERFVDAPYEFGTRTRNLRMFAPHAEKVDQRCRPAYQQVGRIAVEAACDADEIDIEAHRLGVGGVLDRFLAALQELFAQAFDRDRGTVEILHELLDAKIAPVLVAKAELARQFALVVEQQAFLGPAGGQMQRETDAAEQLDRALQRPGLGRRNQILLCQRGECRRIEQAPAEPQHGLCITQSARAVLEVRFEVVGRIAEARMPLQAVRTLGGEVRRPRPHRYVIDERGQAYVERCGTGNAPRIEQAGIDCRILRGQFAAFGERAQCVAGLQTQIPQQHEERFQRTHGRAARRGFTQHEQVDIGKREHRATAEAAHGVQRHRRGFADARCPDMRDDVLDGLAACMSEVERRHAVAPGIDDAAIGVTEQLSQREARRVRHARTRDRRTQSRQIDDRSGWRVGDLAHRMALRPPSARVSVSRIHWRSRPPCVPTVPTTNGPW